MRLRIVLLVSLGVNVALLGALAYALLHQPPLKLTRTRSLRPATNSPVLPTTAGPVRRQNFTWQEIESTDYRSYIANLRAIGCPETTIRDIIVADINTLFDRRRATEIITPEQQWWRSVPDPKVIEAANRQLAALDSERRALLAQLLGPNWDTNNNLDTVELNTHLDGPVLGKLSPRAKQAVRDIENRAVQRKDAYLEAREREGKSPDLRELANLRLQTRNELAKVLTSQELEEYLLRYSQTAESLRNELQTVDIKPEEFRALFRARDAIDQNSLVNFSGDDPASAKQRQLLDQQREEGTKQVLGPERYAMFQVAQNPLFHQARASVEQLGAPPETVLPLFQINQVTEQERQRIQSDATLTLEQRALALANMIRQQRESLRKVLGDVVYERYQQQEGK